MKRECYKKLTILMSVTVIVFLFFVKTNAQASETFDIATFQPPKGWQRQDKNGAIIFTTSEKLKGTYAIITVYTSGTSTGNAKSDFDADWQEFIAGQMEIKAKPETEPAVKADGWEVITGGTGFDNEMGKSAVLMSTYSGHGKSFSMAAVFNSQDSLPAIEAFVSSVKLAKPEIVSPPTPANNNGDASILGSWLSSESDNSRMRVMNGVVSTIFRQYTFNANGTYSFVSKAYDPLMKSTLLGRENGTYKVSGTNITISPIKSVLEEWSKKNGNDEWDKQLKTQNVPLEKVTYQFTKQYVIERWELVLHAASDTKRDGNPSSSGVSNFAWYYPAVISPSNPAIKLPQ